MSVDVGVEGGPGGGGEGAEVALVHDALLISGQGELELGVVALLLQVTVHSVPIGHNTRGLRLGFPSVKYTVVEHLENGINHFVTKCRRNPVDITIVSESFQQNAL